MSTTTAARPKKQQSANSDEPRRRWWPRRRVGVATDRERGASRRASAPRVDPRISARRAEVTRRQGRRRLAGLVAVVVLAGAAVGSWFLLHTPMFSAKVVTVEGAVHTPAASVAAAAGLASHPPLLDVNTGAAATAIEALPWVKSAQVRRSWPDGVRITLTERTPAAVVAHTGGFDLVDATGRVLASQPSAPSGLVHLVVPGTVPAAGASLSPAAAPGLAVLTSLPAAFAAQVSTVSVDATGQVSLALTSPVSVLLGSTAELPAKYEDVASLLAGANLHPGDVLDVTVPDSPVVTGP
jgi:cell division protein FtsQ